MIESFMIGEELARLGLTGAQTRLLREKDGVLVARVQAGQAHYVLKCFRKVAYRREIGWYRALEKLRVPTPRLVAATEASLLLEDVSFGGPLRLGMEADMCDPAVGALLARWYRCLHEAGRGWLQSHPEPVYSEADDFTRETLALLEKRFALGDLPAWRRLSERFEELSALLSARCDTLTYNDFYYTNLMVARDGSSALMFDYNLLGRGCAASDLRNVTSSLSPEAAEAFLAAYGEVPPLDVALDDVTSPVMTLCAACRRETFPAWGVEALALLRDGLDGRLVRLDACLS